MDSVKIGSVDFKGVDFFVGSPGMFGGADGTLGVDFLGSLDVEIDTVKNEVDFFLPNTCGDRVVHWPHNELVEIPLDNKNRDKHIQVTLVLDGNEIPAIIDTGSSETFISWHLAGHLFDLDPKSPGVRALEELNPKYDAEKQAYRYQFKNLSIGDISFSNPLITIIPMMSNGPQMVLGMHELHGLHLYFSYGQHKLYVTTARGDLAASPSQIPQHPNPLEQINAKNYLDMASSALAVKDYDVALKETDAALRLDPGLGFAYLVRGEADHFKGNRGQALEDAAKANQSTPDDPGIYLSRIKFYFLIAEYDLAFKDADRLVQLQPKIGEALNRRCCYAALAKRFNQAFADCDAAIAMEPKSAAALDTRAFAHFKAGQLEQAMSDYNAALQIEPREVRSLYGRGLVKQQKGDQSGAEDDFLNARRIDPKIADRFEAF